MAISIDQLKVLNKAKELGPTWIPIDGYHTLTSLDLSGEKPNFILDSGLPLKTFVNTSSGEIKTFHIKDFLVDGTSL